MRNFEHWKTTTTVKYEVRRTEIDIQLLIDWIVMSVKPRRKAEVSERA